MFNDTNNYSVTDLNICTGWNRASRSRSYSHPPTHHHHQHRLTFFLWSLSKIISVQFVCVCVCVIVAHLRLKLKMWTAFFFCQPSFEAKENCLWRFCENPQRSVCMPLLPSESPGLGLYTCSDAEAFVIVGKPKYEQKMVPKCNCHFNLPAFCCCSRSLRLWSWHYVREKFTMGQDRRFWLQPTVCLRVARSFKYLHQVVTWHNTCVGVSLQRCFSTQPSPLL